MGLLLIRSALFSLLLICSGHWVKAQQLDPDVRRVVASAGDQSSSSSLELSYTIGEVVIFQGSTNERIYTQGFQQGSMIPADDFELGVYNAFSPDGDGTNETWIIDNIELYPENQVTIYNRWGDKVRRIDGYDNNENVWDGRSENGRELPAGTYFYVIEAGPNDEGEPQVEKGYVQITK